MYKFLKRMVLVLLLSAVLINTHSPNLSAQQGGIQVTTLETEILPEYDTPDTLVINTIQFQNKSGQDFSGDLRWVVPNGSKTHILLDNKDQSRPAFNLVQNGSSTELVWKFPQPIKAGETKSIHLEYYFNNFQGSPDKTFSFQLTQPYPVINGQLYVFQPLRATNFRVEPPMGPSQAGPQFTYYQKSYSNLQPGEKIEFSAAYTKTDSNPSTSAPPSSNPQVQSPVDSSSPQTGLDRNTMIYLIAGLAVIIVLLAVKIISNNQRLASLGVNEYEDEDENGDEDEGQEEDELQPRHELKTNGATGRCQGKRNQVVDSALAVKQARLEKEYRAGRITEDDYLMMLEELEGNGK